MDIEHVRSRFIKHFDGTTGAVYASPGRINLIGEHTDYNGGFVFPGAIDKGMIAEIKPNGTDIVKSLFHRSEGLCGIRFERRRRSPVQAGQDISSAYVVR